MSPPINNRTLYYAEIVTDSFLGLTGYLIKCTLCCHWRPNNNQDGKCLHPIKYFNPATFLCLSNAGHVFPSAYVLVFFFVQ